MIYALNFPTSNRSFREPDLVSTIPTLGLYDPNSLCCRASTLLLFICFVNMDLQALQDFPICEKNCEYLHYCFGRFWQDCPKIDYNEISPYKEGLKREYLLQLHLSFPTRWPHQKRSISKLFNLRIVFVSCLFVLK